MALEQLRAFRSGKPLVAETTLLTPENYPLLVTSELGVEHRLLGDVLRTDPKDPERLPLMKYALADKLEVRTRLYLTILERIFAYDAKLSRPENIYTLSDFMNSDGGTTLLVRLWDIGIDPEQVAVPTIEWFTCYRFVFHGIEPLLRALEWVRTRYPELPPDIRALLVEVHGQCTDTSQTGGRSDSVSERVGALLGKGTFTTIAPCEVWTADVTRELDALDPAARDRWIALFEHARKATSARPSDKWLKTAHKHLDAVGRDVFRDALLRWFPLVDAGRRHAMVSPIWDGVDEQARMHEVNGVMLRGLCWLTPEVMDESLTRAVGKLAMSAYRKIRGIGPRAAKVGNACIYALSRVNTADAVGQLALARARVKSIPAQKEIDKAFNAAAEALGLPRDQIEELAVPTYGLEEVGLRREIFGDVIAELRVDGSDAELYWSRDGKPLKSVPAAVKKDHKEDLQELKAALKDIGLMLSAQSERIDACFLLDKEWPLSVWRERYLDHPLVGTIARRLIWTFGDGRSGIGPDGVLVDIHGHAIETSSDTCVSLWHPIGRSVDEVLAWRIALEEREIRQPFKQAHREIYVVTDAERTTRAYSNRFAAHVIRQHPFNALCSARGWRNKLRLMVDDSYPPAVRHLPRFGLRAEFWIDAIGTDYGTDTNDSGAFLRLATDQVRFYREGAVENSAHAMGGGYFTHAGGPGQGDVNEPIPLESVPALAFSEVMRDVDLFVGVTSIGNDPTWQDGGPGGRFIAYWQEFSFGALGETARTRKVVLERLLPRLKIASRCELVDRFLVVRGDLRTYKIHLGSGNILMEPNDKYLCIVPARGAALVGESPRLFLPFEGDSLLSVLLSKAFMLAEDTKIADASILSQIRR